MQNCKPPEIVVTGLGVTSAVGRGREAFANALFAGEGRFAVMERPGRQKNTRFIGAEIPSLDAFGLLPESTMRTASFSAQVALLTLDEAWRDARLHELDGSRIGLIVGGSNVQQRELTLTQERYKDKAEFMRPTYALSFFDTDLCGLCTSAFGIRGLAFTVGGASASGQLAVIEAIEAVESGRVDACIALGALMDLSYWECHGFRNIGAMGSNRYADVPDLACRPFDKSRDGFIYGESCAAVVVERAGARTSMGRKPYARMTGWSVLMDANRNADPSLAGEIGVIRQALSQAGMQPRDIHYVNPHGSGSVVGDTTELGALRECGLAHAAINTTKSITGHGLTAAGAVEVVATLLQLQADELHPCRNLNDPIDSEFDWVREKRTGAGVANCLNLSFGFGGINTALCISRID